MKNTVKEMTLEERQKVAEEIRQHQYKMMNLMEVTNLETFNSFIDEMVPGDDEVWMGNPAMWLNMLDFYPNNEVINKEWEAVIENRSSTIIKAEKDYVAVVSPEYAVYASIGTFSVIDKQGNNTGDIPITSTSVYVKKNNKWKVLHWHNSWQTD